MMNGEDHVSGVFEVNLNPLDHYDSTPGSLLGRMSIDKSFHGELEAKSKGEMLSAMTTTEGSAGYVAIERVSGNLRGRNGTFVLIHLGINNRGTQQLNISVVPDSGTGELTGISGTMTITIEGKKHWYNFRYTIQSRRT
jgi:hypothetical protein